MRKLIAGLFIILAGVIGSGIHGEWWKLISTSDVSKTTKGEGTVLNNSHNAQAKESDPPLDFTGLRGVLAGKWQRKHQSGKGSKASLTEKNTTVEFAGKSIEGKADGLPNNSGKFDLKGDTLHVTQQNGVVNVYGLEFLTDGEFALSPETIRYGDFDDLAGQWKRISLPPGSDLGTGPVADAKRQVKRIEQKEAKLDALLESALADRDDLVTKLRAVGVKATADLKGNVRGQRLAENIAKITTEIEGLERELVLIDSELLKAKSIARRMEREQAGISEDEMRKLAEQLREIEERTDGITASPTTPLDVDVAVEKALKATPKANVPKKTK